MAGDGVAREEERCVVAGSRWVDDSRGSEVKVAGSKTTRKVEFVALRSRGDSYFEVRAVKLPRHHGLVQ
jgi:hypothetical protein